MKTLTKLTIDYLKLQISAGVDAVQLFDSWAGIVPTNIYENFILPYNQEIAKNINIPTIYYIKKHSSRIISK